MAGGAPVPRRLRAGQKWIGFRRCRYHPSSAAGSGGETPGGGRCRPLAVPRGSRVKGGVVGAGAGAGVASPCKGDHLACEREQGIEIGFRKLAPAGSDAPIGRSPGATGGECRAAQRGVEGFGDL
jgi:hypothetical protein